MFDTLIQRATRHIASARPVNSVARVSKIAGYSLQIDLTPSDLKLGDRAILRTESEDIRAEVIGMEPGKATLMAESPLSGVVVGADVFVTGQPTFRPDSSWIGRVIDPDGKPIDGRPLLPGLTQRKLTAAPPDTYQRRGMGKKLSTGYALFDTILPIASGQRIGIFAGSGVGKSTLLGGLAQKIETDVVVVALVGERGREVRDFVKKSLGPEGLKRSVVVAATSDRSAAVRHRCVASATTIAEYFRDQGKNVLLLVDSVTRFAEAHREIVGAAGSESFSRDYPISTATTIAGLCERAGSGGPGQGNITALYSVLVAGSDMEEPVADILRGILDGHFVLDRTIAEKGRFPAVDILKSVSRCLPDAATANENKLIGECRQILGAYEESSLMIQSGLYSKGSDRLIDRAVQLRPKLEDFFAVRGPQSAKGYFEILQRALS